MAEETKIGARNNRNDQRRILAHDLLVENGAMYKVGGKSLDPDDTLIFTGGEVKATRMGDGTIHIRAPLVVFTDANNPDLTGKDYFDATTDFGIDEWPAKSATYFQHGADSHFKRRRLTPVTLTIDEFAVWADGILNEIDQYEKFLADLAGKKKLGMSSGVPAHLVEREPVGNAMHIKTWPLGLDASYTHTPAESKTRDNSIVTLKSLFTEPEVGGDPTAAATKSDPEQEHEMDELEVKKLIDAALEQERAAVKATEMKAAEMKTAEDAGYKKAVEELTSKGWLKKAPAYIKKPGDDNDGVDAFKSWIVTGQENDGLIRPDSSMLSIKGAGDAFNVTTTGSGGALVPDPLYNQVIAKRNASSWIRRAPCQYFTTMSDHLLIPREVTSMSDFVSTAESAAYDENEGTVGQIDLALIKYTKMTQATEEFLTGENSNWETWFMQRLGDAAANTENTIATAAFLAGATAATAAASQTALTIAEMERMAGTLGEGYAVTGQTGYIMKRSTHFYLRGIQLSSAQPWNFGGEPVYEAAGMGAMTNALYSTGFGNFNYFAVLERPGMLIQRNPWLHMATGEIDFFANIYRAVAVLQGEAFYKMAQA